MGTYLCPKLEKRKSRAAFSRLRGERPCIVLEFTCKIYLLNKKSLTWQSQTKKKINDKRHANKIKSFNHRYSRGYTERNQVQSL